MSLAGQIIEGVKSRAGALLEDRIRSETELISAANGGFVRDVTFDILAKYSIMGAGKDWVYESVPGGFAFKGVYKDNAFEFSDYWQPCNVIVYHHEGQELGSDECIEGFLGNFMNQHLETLDILADTNSLAGITVNGRPAEYDGRTLTYESADGERREVQVLPEAAPESSQRVH